MQSVPILVLVVVAVSAHYPYHHHLPVYPGTYPRLYRGTYPSYYPALYPAYYPHLHPAVQIQQHQSSDLIGNGGPADVQAMQESLLPPDPPSSLQIEATNASLSSVLVMTMMIMIMIMMTLSSVLVVAGRSGHNCTEDGATADTESGCTQFYVCSGDKVGSRE